MSFAYPIPVALPRRRRIISPGEWLREKIEEQRREREATIARAITADVANLGSNSVTAAANTIAFTTGSTVASGARIVVAAGWFSNSITLSSVSGGGLTWTIDKQGRPTNPAFDSQGIASAPAPSGLASGTTITATLSGSADARTIGGLSLLGVDTSTPVDVTSGPTGVNPSSTAWSTASISIAAGSCIVAAAWGENTSAGSTPTSPSLEAFDVANGDGYEQTACYRIESSAGSYTVAGTWGSSTQSGIIAVAYKAAAGGGGGVTVKALAALGVG